MLWRPSCPPFCKHVTDMSEINFNMLNRFLDLKNLCVATESMCLAHILKKILRILSFGGHLGRHLEYFNFPNDAKVASFSFNVRTYWRTHLCKNILCGLFFWVAPKIFIWQPDYIQRFHCFIYCCHNFSQYRIIALGPTYPMVQLAPVSPIPTWYFYQILKFMNSNISHSVSRNNIQRIF